MAKKISPVQMQQLPRESPWKRILLVLFGLWIIAVVSAAILSLSLTDDMTGNVKVIPVYGVIAVGAPGMFDSEVADSSTIVQAIQDAQEDEMIKAIVLDINSPGGTAVASEEIVRALQRSNKTTVALIREVGASGGFWVATAADHVVASPISITGSIGVIASYLDFSGFIQEHNVSYERLVAGDQKDIGSPLRKMTGAERELFQEQLDQMHDYFMDSVAQNRNLSREHVGQDATGAIFLGKRAQERGYVDELGDMHSVQQYLERELNESVTFSQFEKEVSLLDLLNQLKAGQKISFEAVSSGIQVRT